MKRIYPAFAAMLCTLPLLHTAASAEDAALTFELTVDDSYVFASELAEKDFTVGGAFWIRNYTAFSGMKTILTSDAPVIIEDGHFTEPNFFASSSYQMYRQKSEITDDTNIIMWSSPDDPETLDFAPNEVANPEGSFAEFTVRVPKETAPGVYHLEFRNGYIQENPGIIVEDTYVKMGRDAVPFTLQGCRIVVEPDALRGDVNCDGKIDISDAKRTLDYHVLTNLLDETPDDAGLERHFATPYIHTALSAADAKQDGVLDSEDARAILNYYTILLTDAEPDWAECVS